MEKKKIQHQYGVSRCSYGHGLQDSSTVPLRLIPAALRFTPMELRMLKNAHDAVTIRYGATTVQGGSATTASRSPTNVHDLAVFM